MTSEELEMVATNDLITELRRRHAASVFIFYHDLDEEKDAVTTYFGGSGGTTMALGLLQRGVDTVMEEVKSMRGTREEEE